MLNQVQETALTLNSNSSGRAGATLRASGPIKRSRKAFSALAISGRNTRRHGIQTLNVVLDDESRPAFKRLLKSYTDRFQPMDDFEFTCVEELAHITWRLQRIRTVEATMFNDLAARKKEISQSGRVAAAFREMSFGSALPLLLRYETSLQNMRKNTLNNLSLIRKAPEFNAIDLDSITYDVVGEHES